MRHIILAVLTTVMATTPAAAQEEAQQYDVLIRGGRVVDGSGNPWYRADVAVADDRIVAIGDLAAARAHRVIDAEGLYVAPGFIDPHTHARGNLFELPEAESYLRQGITTVIDGNDGGSPLPIGPYLDSVAELGPSPNFGLFVGHGSVRRTVLGTADRRPTADELTRMKRLVEGGLEQGALGLSTGLAYAPGSYASTEEVIALARVAAEHGGIYISHMRDEGENVLASVRETIRIGEEAGIPVQMTHHKVGGHRQWGQSETSIALMRDARGRGVDITFDQYPYTASSTGLSFLFPKWALANDRLEERLADEATRRRIIDEMLAFIDERFADDPARIQLVDCDFDSSLGGQTLADLLRRRGRTLSAAATAELVIELETRGDCGAILHSYDEGDVERLLAAPYGMIGSDGALVPHGEGYPHPRAYGTFPRVLGRYVRERGVLSLEQAVQKMTSFPAQRLGFQDRGLVREGMAADLVVFDPRTVEDRATFESPHRYPVGIVHVVVNGVAVIDNGRHTGARPGRVLKGAAAPAASVPTR